VSDRRRLALSLGGRSAAGAQAEPDRSRGNARAHWSRASAIALLLIVAGAVSITRIGDFDTPWHLATGEEILRRGELPREDPFSYTATRPWLIHEWLSEVLLALTHRAAGLAGLGVLQGLIVSMTLGILLWACAGARRDPLGGLAVLAYAAGAVLLREAVSPRAQLFSLPLFAATLALCVRDEAAAAEGRAPPRPGLLLVLPLGLLWAQLHGGNPTGVALLALLFLARPGRRRAAIAVGAALLTCAGPYGVWVHEHILAAQSIVGGISEWLPLSAALAAGSEAHFAFTALLVAAAFGLWARARAGEAVRFEALALAAFALLAMRHVRLATEATLVATTALAPALARVRVPLRLRALLWPAALALLALPLAISPRRPGFGLEETRFPIAAVDWLRRTHPPGPLFNGYNFGGYLLWAWPEEKVFIDGRAVTVYEPALIEELLAVLEQPSRFLELERRYGFRVALLQHQGGGWPLFAWLRNRPEWSVAYADDRAAVLVRRSDPQ
jgi:hypothetical protein